MEPQQAQARDGRRRQAQVEARVQRVRQLALARRILSPPTACQRLLL